MEFPAAFGSAVFRRLSTLTPEEDAIRAGFARLAERTGDGGRRRRGTVAVIRLPGDSQAFSSSSVISGQCNIRKDGDALLDTGPIGVGSGLHPQASRRHPRALPIASPLKSGCATLFSKDLQDGQVVDGRLTIRNPFGTLGQ
jgi:hypothetical protein